MSALESPLRVLLPAFLPRQRWFGGKARTITGCEIEDYVALGDAPARLALVVASVSFADGGAADRYGLLVSSRTDPGSLPSIGLLGNQGGASIVEATTDAASARALLNGFTGGGDMPMRHGGTLRYADASAATRQMLAQDTPRVSAVGAEQSNTSVRVGAALVFKLFRRLDAGENPELEIGRFLTSRTTFRALSTLDGSLTYLSRTGETYTVGILQGWIDNQGDGWRYVLGQLRGSSEPGGSGSVLVSDMAALGRVTADCHAALASDKRDSAFAPEPVTGSDVDAWQAQVVERTSRVFRLLARRLEAWPEPTRRLAMSLLGEQGLAAAPAPPAVSGDGGFQKIRIHGDYHLGQTLKTASGFAIIDFEGEPARPLAERRRKHAALKDVAGMLRSFEYAVETVASDTPGATRIPQGALDLRRAFLQGYLASSHNRSAHWIPADPRALDGWLAFLEFDKALYELEYEINNRPDWVHIPLRGILGALADSRRATDA